MFRDAFDFSRKCQECQRAGGRLKKAALPLHPLIIKVPFQQWGLDIVGPITPASSQQHKYILTATDYFTRWVEAIPLRLVNSEQVISFLDSFIITRFGVPESLIFDNATYFSSVKLTEYALEKGIKLKY